MAVIHNTTLTPGKLELAASWLPTQPWYLGAEGEPELTKAGGFRLDDPQGEVGIEFVVVTDASGDRPVSYHLPLTYRGAPLDGADQALIGTAEHGVLGRRWFYDGTHDPVLVAQLLALLQGDAEPQAQSASNTPDPSVTGHLSRAGLSDVAGPMAVAHGPYGTELTMETLTLRVTRVLGSDQQGAGTPEPRGHVTAAWRSPDGDERRDRFVLLFDAAR
jgi:Maltokinase N-terminal cap domain